MANHGWPNSSYTASMIVYVVLWYLNGCLNHIIQFYSTARHDSSYLSFTVLCSMVINTGSSSWLIMAPPTRAKYVCTLQKGHLHEHGVGLIFVRKWKKTEWSNEHEWHITGLVINQSLENQRLLPSQVTGAWKCSQPFSGNQSWCCVQRT